MKKASGEGLQLSQLSERIPAIEGSQQHLTPAHCRRHEVSGRTSSSYSIS